MDPALGGEDDVSQAREGLEEAENPERPAEADHLGEHAAREDPHEAPHEPHRGERHAAVEVAVAHVDEKRALEGLGEVVGELVEKEEGEDAERPVAGEEAHERIPGGLLEAPRRGDHLARLGRLPGDEEHRQIEAGEPGVDERPGVAPGEGDPQAPHDVHGAPVDGVSRPDGDRLLLGLQDVDGIGVDRDVLAGAAEGDGEGERGDHPRGVRVAPHPREAEGEDEESELRDRRPTPPPPQPRRHEAVHERRPEELERPRRLRQGDEPHHPNIEPDPPHPVGDGGQDQGVGQAGRERKKGDRGRPPGGHRPGEALQGARALGGWRKRHLGWGWRHRGNRDLGGHRGILGDFAGAPGPAQRHLRNPRSVDPRSGR